MVSDLEEELEKLHREKFDDAEAADRAKSAMRKNIRERHHSSRKQKAAKSESPQKLPQSTRKSARSSKRKNRVEYSDEEDMSD